MPTEHRRSTVTGQAIIGLPQSFLMGRRETAMRFVKSTALLLSLACATQGVAETPLTADEFDAYALGKTLTYSVAGQVYGAEQYLPGRRVVWAFKDDQCADGIWYEKAGLICFVYENNSAPQCWNFYLGEAGLRAEFIGDTAGSSLSDVDQSPTPLACAGPDVGV